MATAKKKNLGGRPREIKGKGEGETVCFWVSASLSAKLRRLAAEEVGCKTRSQYLRKLLQEIV